MEYILQKHFKECQNLIMGSQFLWMKSTTGRVIRDSQELFRATNICAHLVRSTLEAVGL